MQLNEKDLARMPQDFSAQLKMAVPGTNITVSNTPCNIPDGFLLVYGGIDVNCTFASLFEAAGDTLQDLAGGMLFRRAAGRKGGLTNGTGIHLCCGAH